IVSRSFRTSEDGAAAVFLVTVLMMRHAARGAKDLRRTLLVKRHPAIRARKLVGHLLLVPFAEVERVTPDLYEIAAIERAPARGLPGHKYWPHGVKKRLRPPQLDAGVLRLNSVVLEQVDVRSLAAADHGYRFVENELLSSQRS